MARMKKPGIGSQARDLARMWGRRFGHVSAADFARTIGIMKSILHGDEEMGIAAYASNEIARCIEWLASADAHDEAVNIYSPGVIRDVIQDCLDGKRVQDTFLVAGKHKGRVVEIV